MEGSIKSIKFTFILAFSYSINGCSNPVTELIFSLDNPFDIHELAWNLIIVFETSTSSKYLYAP